MGIFCEINLFKPIDGVYKPGQVVSGIIKYNIDAPMEVDKIVTSLKGIGRIILTSKGGKNHTTYKGEEDYVDVDTVIQDGQINLPVGLYQAKFSYKLPETLPSSMKFLEYFKSFKVNCSIKYYIRIKFEKPGLFAFDNHFRKEINVISKVDRTLLREPVVYGVTKSLFQLFSFSASIVNIKATIFNSAVPMGGKFDLQYEVENNSHVVVKCIIIKLVQTYTFKAKKYPKVTQEEDVPGTETRTLCVNCKQTHSTSISINAPAGIYSIANSKIVSRDYLISITAKLPLPHRNAVLKIPVQIGVYDEGVEDNSHQQMNEHASENPPPSYWEAMGWKKNDYDSSDDEAEK